MSLSNCLTEAFAAATSHQNDGFDGMTPSNSKALASLLVVLLFIVVLLLVGKWLWNVVVVKLVSVARPASSVWQILGLYFILALLQN